MKEVKRGDRVSINPDRRAYFFQTPGGISLAAGATEMAIIPETATDEHLKQINMAISNEHLVPGWSEKKVDLPDRDSDLKVLLESGRNKIDEWINDLREDKKIKKSEKVSNIEKLIALEKVGKNRKSVIKFAENSLEYIGGISKVEESEQEKVEIKLVPVEEAVDEPLDTK